MVTHAQAHRADQQAWSQIVVACCDCAMPQPDGARPVHKAIKSVMCELAAKHMLMPLPTFTGPIAQPAVDVSNRLAAKKP